MRCILVDRSILEFERILKQITHMEISIMTKFDHKCIAFTKTLIHVFL